MSDLERLLGEIVLPAAATCGMCGMPISLCGGTQLVHTKGMAEERANLLAELERLRAVVEKATGLVRTAHPTDVGLHEVVRQWWVALVGALTELEGKG